ncbi:hypothetical protein VB773_09095 [Haloarculaceae archaeon H-GB2-1]|nr:hypothetical protein [Haloarculaceae archaeon H-GB1-1]MEA5407707.1 hypothetical protein [Haloarculaceae archaeon H-GB2-1]
MDEPEVIEHLAHYLDDQGYTFFVDSGAYGDLPYELAERLENCGINTGIRIGNRIPDIIGFTPSEDIFAVEAKGNDNLRKGIGQAAHYRQGVHKSYISADSSELDEFDDTALSCGLGIFPVELSGVNESQIEHPVENIGATKLNRTRRALNVRTSRFEPHSAVIPSTTRPENALLPVIAIKQENKQLSDDELEEVYSESPQGLSTVMHSVTLARTLRLVTKVDGKYQLTDEGEMAYLLLSGIVDHPPDVKYLEMADSDTLHEKMFKILGAIKKSGQYQNTKLFSHSTELATFLRNQYMNIPDVRLLTYILASYRGNRVELSKAMALVALESPDAFLGLFCSSGKEDEFREQVEDENLSVDDSEFQEDLLEIAGSNALYNFLYQIWNVEILIDGTDPVHQDDELIRGEFYWEWDSNIVSRLASTI